MKLWDLFKDLREILQEINVRSSMHTHTIPERHKEALDSIKSVGVVGIYNGIPQSIDGRAAAELSHSIDDNKHWDSSSSRNPPTVAGRNKVSGHQDTLYYQLAVNPRRNATSRTTSSLTEGNTRKITRVSTSQFTNFRPQFSRKLNMHQVYQIQSIIPKISSFE